MNYSNEIKSSLTMLDVVNHYGFTPNRAGFICCPFHAEKTASCKCYPTSFHCFGCGSHGSVIDFVMKLFNMQYNDAVSKLNDDFMLGLPMHENISLRERRERERYYKRRTAEMNRKKQEREQLEKDYNEKLDRYCKLDKDMRQHKPSSPDDELNPLYVEAAKNIGIASYELAVAETRLASYDTE